MKAVVAAYAKINLLLDVLRKRSDGYHEVEMVMQSIALHDRLVIEPWNQLVLDTQDERIPKDGNNLALKAAMLMQRQYQLPPVKITLEKHIPVSAGLAGGSTDAAAVLLGMNALFALNLSAEVLMDMGARLGSDVPFCMAGPTALATGRGEKLKPLPECPKLYLVLVKPPFGVSTPNVYKNLHLGAQTTHPAVAQYVEALGQNDVKTILSKLENILESSTFLLHPAVAQLKQTMQSLGGSHTLMSGSGPTVFSAFEQKEQASAFYEKIKHHVGQVILTETISSELLNERVTLHD